jgi:hypothetical protein
VKITGKYKKEEAYCDVLSADVRNWNGGILGKFSTYPTNHMNDGPNDDVFMNQ